MRRPPPALRIAMLCVGLGGVLACAAAGPRQAAVSEPERQQYAGAISSLSSDPAAAKARLEAFVRDWPQSRLSADAVFRLGEIAREQHDADGALARYAQVIRQYPRSEKVDSARLGTAIVEYERANRVGAARMLRNIRLRELSADQRRVAYRLLADTSASTSEKLQWLAELRSDSPTNPQAIDAEIDELLALLDDRDLAQLANEIEPKVPAGRAVLVVVERALERRDRVTARAGVDRASDLPLEGVYASRFERAVERLQRIESGGDAGFPPDFDAAHSVGLPDTRAARGEIGVVLPLSGKFASFGEQSLRGILLAAGVFDAVTPETERPQIRLQIRDSAGDPSRAAAAVRELAKRPGVPAILGPLLSSECEAAADAAEAAGVPLIALTSREEVAHDRLQAFRVRTMPKDEVRLLVDYAVRDLGATHFGILYPRDAYGLGLSDLFWNAVESRGGSIVAVSAYEPGSTDFGDAIRRLVGYDLLTHAEKEAIKEREERIKSARRLPAEEAAVVREEARAMLGPDGQALPPIVDFDALFIPESHENVVLIAPQLAYYEVTGTVLLGSDAWNDPSLVEIGRDHVDGSRFTANFYADSSLEVVRDFADRYQASFGVGADEFAAQAYDATNLVLLPLARGATSRSAIREALLSTSGFAGASGVLSMGADGNARKRPFLLGVDRGRIVQID